MGDGWQAAVNPRGLELHYWKNGRHLGSVQQFFIDGPYYGTWSIGDGPMRTGAVMGLSTCKTRVENAVNVSCRDYVVNPAITAKARSLYGATNQDPEWDRTLPVVRALWEDAVFAFLQHTNYAGTYNPHDLETWFYYPIVMPLKDGRGPASDAECDTLTWEVWDRLHQSHSAHGTMADAMRAAMRMNKEAVNIRMYVDATKEKGPFDE